MRSPQHPHHRLGPGNRSMKLDPYALDDTTVTLEEWRRSPAGQRRQPSTQRPRPHPKAA